ncbi:hypothetical protein MKW94_007162 [Papaver nudicaule]|uniref:Uncharacterized protein n=1 Tax=Papaver nudicaule TaxID=74823 RepID=A0AA41UYB0_PAPNU|nr:hypothetical protein [Papaver nudicaule]
MGGSGVAKAIARAVVASLSEEDLLIGNRGTSQWLVFFLKTLKDVLQESLQKAHNFMLVTVIPKCLKLTTRDTTGQERFRNLISFYYRSAQGINLVYDLTRRESFTNLTNVWDVDRAVTREEGVALANDFGCLFLECGERTRENVEKCFEELALKIMDVPSLLDEGSNAFKMNNILK